MLTKQEIKGCLAGEPTPVVPARYFAMDGKFIEKHTGEVEKMRQMFEDDFVSVLMLGKKRIPGPDLESDELTDEWGCRFAAAPDGVGSHPTKPIVNSMEDWERYVAEDMPRLDSDLFTQQLRELVRNHPERYNIAQFWRTFYERMYMLIGFEQLMVEIATEGELFTRMLSVLFDYTIRGIKLMARAGPDAVHLADDWGTQRRLQISPEMWRKYFKPAYAAMMETAHLHGMDVWFHSCGNITEIIPDWIEIGLDVIGDLQAAALDLPAIANAYRGQISFLGGIDVQYNVVNGARESIRREVRDLVDMFHAHQGRYMLMPCNTIMPETPVQNVWTLFEAIREFGAMSSQ